MNRPLVSIAAALLLSGGCASSPESGQPAPAPLAVSTITARSVEWTTSFDAGGVVRARSTAAVASRVMAPILEIHVRPGDRVRRGTPLVTLDSREVAANRARAAAALASAGEAVHAAESEVHSAEAAARLARATHDRMQTLHDRRSATPQELDQAVAALTSADAQRSGARARLAAASAARDAAQSASEGAAVAASYAVLVAPFDGLITDRSADPGAMAAPGVPLLTMEDATAFRLEVALDEARATRVVLGQTADVEIGDRTAADYWTGAARVSEVARLDSASHSFLVKLDLAGPLSLRSGVFGRARFAGPTRHTLVVPASAAVRRGQLTFVYTVDAQNRARLQHVSTGAEARDQVEVLAGIREGDRIITNPPVQLSDGAPVSGEWP